MEFSSDNKTRSFIHDLMKDFSFKNQSQNLQVTLPSFGVNILPIPELENEDIHYKCPKCFNFPLIEFIDKNEEMVIYSCGCYKKKLVSVKDLFYNGKDITKKYLSFPDNNNLIKNSYLNFKKILKYKILNLIIK